MVAIAGVQKVPSGISGLDEVTGGGLPLGRPILVCGSAGAGKTLFGTQFLVEGIHQAGEPGVFLSFEESAADLAANVASLGYDLDSLVEQGLLAIDHVDLHRADIVETGDFTLEGLLIRLELAIDRVQARRVVIDTMEVLFGTFQNTSLIRTEMQRLFRWLKARGLTTVITAERGQAGALTRFGIEEYASDCVILLDHRVDAELSTRRLRVIKYRGALHGTNEYPFLIMRDGFSVLPITSLSSKSLVSNDRVSSGLPTMDELLGGGVYRGSSVLIGGESGAGKSTLAAHFAAAACAEGESVVLVSYEEAPAQLLRNLASVSLHLEPFVEQGLLHIVSLRATMFGLEEHLVRLIREVDDHQPDLVIVDPLTALKTRGDGTGVTDMVLRWLEFLKSRGITSVSTSLSAAARSETDLHVSSMIDTWIKAKTIELNGETNRVLQIIKSRGSAHSRQLSEFEISSEGITIFPPYIGSGQVLTGSARLAQEAADRETVAQERAEVARRVRLIDAREQEVEAKIAALRSRFEEERSRLLALNEQIRERQERKQDFAHTLSRHRSNDN